MLRKNFGSIYNVPVFVTLPIVATYSVEKPGYVATIYAIASGIGKLAKLSKVEKSYRGIS